MARLLLATTFVASLFIITYAQRSDTNDVNPRDGRIDGPDSSIPRIALSDNFYEDGMCMHVCIKLS